MTLTIPQGTYLITSSNETVRTSAAKVCVAAPDKLIRRLSNHFRHKIAVELREASALFRFAEGTAELVVGEECLRCYCAAAQVEALREIEETIERHLLGMETGVTPPLIWARAA